MSVFNQISGKFLNQKVLHLFCVCFIIIFYSIPDSNCCYFLCLFIHNNYNSLNTFGDLNQGTKEYQYGYSGIALFHRILLIFNSQKNESFDDKNQMTYQIKSKSSGKIFFCKCIKISITLNGGIALVMIWNELMPEPYIV
jgi:hypothetical protein